MARGRGWGRMKWFLAGVVVGMAFMAWIWHTSDNPVSAPAAGYSVSEERVS